MKQRLLMVVLLALTATGCSIYHPQAVNIPLVNHRGDAQVDLSAGVSAWVVPDVLTFNATGSYGFGDWLAGQAHVNYGFENAYGHAALGVYRRLGTYGVAEGYMGMGLGGAWRDGTSPDSDDTEAQQAGVKKYDYSGNFLLPFVQGNIGLRDLARGHVDLAFGFKVGSFIPDFKHHSYDAAGELVPDRSKPYSTTSLLLEPQVQLRVGSQHVKWNVRVGFAWLSDVIDADANFTYDWLTVSTGLTFLF